MTFVHRSRLFKSILLCQIGFRRDAFASSLHCPVLACSTPPSAAPRAIESAHAQSLTAEAPLQSSLLSSKQMLNFLTERTGNHTRARLWYAALLPPDLLHKLQLMTCALASVPWSLMTFVGQQHCREVSSQPE
eukprot:5542607-Amphidinium_carterae.1